MKEIILDVIKNYDEKNVVEDHPDGVFAQFSRFYGNDCGITVCGQYDDDNRFHVEYYYPFFRGTGITTQEQVTVERHADKDAFSAACDDLRIGITLIFYLQNAAEYMKESGKEKNAAQTAHGFLEGESEEARKLYNYVGLVAPTQMSVLINGASGTGKEYVAHRIHQLSKRSEKPFIAIDCGSIPKDLAASEFFGHVKGSFTGALNDKAGAFEEANGGTLFLDEIGNLSYEVQVQLLRALQERRIRRIGSTKEIEVDVRLISATNENLKEAIAKGNFREDLYHRINEFTLQMPSLKERPEDILLFANFFLDQANHELERTLIGFDAEASEAMQKYPWPGNLRQLKNVVKRATLLAQGEFITAKDLGEEINERKTVCENPEMEETFALHDEETEKHRILKALQQTGNNKTKAATLLGIDRKTLYNKLKLYHIPQ